jgi:Kae1-associated kinase Bud32
MKEKGAEATIEVIEGKVLKNRKPKKYRHNELDEEIRKERTDTEVKLMKEAIKYGVTAPRPEKKDESTIAMEKIDGRPIKEIIEKKPEIMKDLGDNIAKLHSADVIHGDLTTSNALYDEGLYVIDFGLSFRSERVEDKAVDIHLLKQVLGSSHPEVAEEAWEKFVEGYRSYEQSGEVLDQLEEVEKRGRYK